MLQLKFVVSEQDFMELCHNRVFYLAIESGLDQRI